MLRVPKVYLLMYHITVKCLEKLTKYLHTFTKSLHVPVHEDVTKLM